MMDEPLFIDLVDLEWGFRASARGYRHFQSPRPLMSHTLGSGRIGIGGRSISLHAPSSKLLHYQKFDNVV